MIVTTLQVAPATTAQAAAKAKLSKKTLTLTVGKSKTLTLKNVKKSVAKKATWKTSKKKVATVSKKGTVKAKKAGKATITCTYKLAGKKKKLTCKVTVKKAKQTQNAVQVAPTQAPATQAPPPAAPTPEGIQTKKNVTIMLKSVSGKTITNQVLIICCQEPIRLLLVWDQGWNR